MLLWVVTFIVLLLVHPIFRLLYPHACSIPVHFQNVFAIPYHAALRSYLSHKISTPLILIFTFSPFTQIILLSPFPNALQIPPMHLHSPPVLDKLVTSLL